MNRNIIKKILKEGLMLPYASLKNRVYKFLDENVVGIFETYFDDTFLICTNKEDEIGFFVEIKEPEASSDGWTSSGAYKSGYTVRSYHMGPMAHLLNTINVQNPEILKLKEINMAILDWFLDNKERYNI